MRASLVFKNYFKQIESIEEIELELPKLLGSFSIEKLASKIKKEMFIKLANRGYFEKIVEEVKAIDRTKLQSEVRSFIVFVVRLHLMTLSLLLSLINICYLFE